MNKCLICKEFKIKTWRERKDLYICSDCAKIHRKPAVARWRIRNPEKRKAQIAVFVNLRNGKLKKEKCFCGIEKVEAHHNDYSKPLDVIWVCKKHHIELDKERRLNESGSAKKLCTVSLPKVK